MIDVGVHKCECMQLHASEMVIWFSSSSWFWLTHIHQNGRNKLASDWWVTGLQKLFIANIVHDSRERLAGCSQSLSQTQQLNYQSQIKCEKQKPQKNFKFPAEWERTAFVCIPDSIVHALHAVTICTPRNISYFCPSCIFIVDFHCHFNCFSLPLDHTLTTTRFCSVNSFFPQSVSIWCQWTTVFTSGSVCCTGKKHNRVIIYFGFSFIATSEHRHEVACTMHSKYK